MSSKTITRKRIEKVAARLSQPEALIFRQGGFKGHRQSCSDKETARSRSRR